MYPVIPSPLPLPLPLNLPLRATDSSPISSLQDNNSEDNNLTALEFDYNEVVEYATYDERLGKSHLLVPGPDGEFGFGGEIGISTDKLHVRGPVGSEHLTSFKYVVYGNGQVRQ